MSSATVVLSRCAEPGLGAPRGLSKIPFLVYQKGGSCNTSRGVHTLSQIPQSRIRMMDGNSGDECAAYLQYLVDEYDRLPDATVFLQYASEMQVCPQKINA